jgi:hypothetical protein
MTRRSRERASTRLMQSYPDLLLLQIGTALLFCTLATFGAPVAAQETPAPTKAGGWTAIRTGSGEHKMFIKYLLPAASKSYAGAAKFCEDTGGYWADFVNFTAAEFAAIVALPSPSPSPTAFYIGLFKAANKDREWYWDDAYARSKYTAYNKSFDRAGDFALGPDTGNTDPSAQANCAFLQQTPGGFSVGSQSCNQMKESTVLGVVCQTYVVYSAGAPLYMQGAGWADGGSGTWSNKTYPRSPPPSPALRKRKHTPARARGRHQHHAETRACRCPTGSYVRGFALKVSMPIPTHARTHARMLTDTHSHVRTSAGTSIGS